MECSDVVCVGRVQDNWVELGGDGMSWGELGGDGMSWGELGRQKAPWGLALFRIPPGSPDANTTWLPQLPQMVKLATQVRRESRCVTVVVASDNLTFVEAFTRESQRGRLLGSATRLLLLSGLPLEALNHLLQHRWTFTMMNSMLLHLRDLPDNSSWCDVYVHLPYFPGGAQMVLVARWSQERGLSLTSDIQLFPDKFSNFYGSKVNVTSMLLPPYWQVDEHQTPDGSRVQKHFGRDHFILQAVAKNLNFTLNVFPVIDIETMVKLVGNRTALVAGVRIGIMPQLLKFVDYSFIIERATLGFSMAKPTIQPGWQSLLHPITYQVWTGVIVLLLLVSGVLFVMLHSKYPQGTGRHVGVSRVFLEVLGMLVGQASSQRLTNWTPARLLVATWLMFSFIMVTAYTSNLVAVLTYPRYPPQPETIEELASTNAKVIFDAGSLPFYNYFKASTSADYREISKRVEFVKSENEGLQKASEGNVASFGERRNMQLFIAEYYTKPNGRPSLYVAKQNVLPGYAAWFLPHDASYKKNIDSCLMAITEAGLKEKWMDDVMMQALENIHKKQRENVVNTNDASNADDARQPLTLKHLQGPWCLLLLGLAAATFAFFMEFLIGWRHARHKQHS